MKITKKYLQELIKEEANKIIREQEQGSFMGIPTGPGTMHGGGHRPPQSDPATVANGVYTVLEGLLNAQSGGTLKPNAWNDAMGALMSLAQAVAAAHRGGFTAVREETAKVLSEDDAEFTQAELTTQLKAAEAKLRAAKAGKTKCDTACQSNLKGMIRDIKTDIAAAK